MKPFFFTLVIVSLLNLVACQMPLPVPLVEPTPTPEVGGILKLPDYIEAVPDYVSLYQTLQPIPLLSPLYPDFGPDEAYLFQEAFVASLEEAGEQRLGHKLGLTGPTRPFGAPEAVRGSLFKSMLRDPNTVINSTEFVRSMVEVELAFHFATDVAYPATEESLRASVAEVAPAIELPDLVFEDMPNLSWLDLVALNVVPRQLILGEPRPLDDLDLDAIQTVATHDGDVINEAPGAASLGGQWQALLFLVEKLHERGQQIKAGEWVITGSLGPLLPGQPGSYVVDYGPLGQINFELE